MSDATDKVRAWLYRDGFAPPFDVFRDVLIEIEDLSRMVAAFRTEVAAARAAGFAEGVALAAEAVKHLSHEDGLGMGSQRLESAIKGLSPAGLVVVPRETLERVREALLFANSEDHELPCDECPAAIAALDGLLR